MEHKLSDPAPTWRDQTIEDRLNLCLTYLVSHEILWKLEAKSLRERIKNEDISNKK